MNYNNLIIDFNTDNVCAIHVIHVKTTWKVNVYNDGSGIEDYKLLFNFKKIPYNFYHCLIAYSSYCSIIMHLYIF